MMVEFEVPNAREMFLPQTSGRQPLQVPDDAEDGARVHDGRAVLVRLMRHAELACPRAAEKGRCDLSYTRISRSQSNG
jgi:hypothetical protein